MSPHQTFDLAVSTLIRAASAPGFKDSPGAKEFFCCEDIDLLLEMNGEPDNRAARTYPQMAFPTQDVSDLCVSVLRRLLLDSA